MNLQLEKMRSYTFSITMPKTKISKFNSIEKKEIYKSTLTLRKFT